MAAENVKDPTLKNILFLLGGMVTFLFTLVTYAFGGDIALYTMAVKNEIFWESEYGYTDWNASSESGSTKSVYHTEAEELETSVLTNIGRATTAVGIAGSILSLVIIGIAFFRKDGGLIYMFRDVR